MRRGAVGDRRTANILCSLLLAAFGCNTERSPSGPSEPDPVPTSLQVLISAGAGRAGVLLQPQPQLRVIDQFGRPYASPVNVTATLNGGVFASGRNSEGVVSQGGLAQFTSLFMIQRGTYLMTYAAPAFGLLATKLDTVPVYANDPVQLHGATDPFLLSRGQVVFGQLVLRDSFGNESNWIDNGFISGFTASCPTSSGVTVFFVFQPNAFRPRPEMQLSASIFAPLGVSTCTAARGSLAGTFRVRVQ